MDGPLPTGCHPDSNAGKYRGAPEPIGGLGPSRLDPKADDDEPAFGTDKKKARQLSIAEALGGGQKKQRA